MKKLGIAIALLSLAAAAAVAQTSGEKPLVYGTGGSPELLDSGKVNDGNSILAALELQERYQISFWDALVIHAAQTAGVATLYSEDLSDGQQYGGVQVRNPLAGAASR